MDEIVRACGSKHERQEDDKIQGGERIARRPIHRDRERAGEKYEDLRRTLIKFFEWRGTPFPEDHTDETLNRVARKLAEGIEIKNIGGYCYEVARLVCLEVRKGNDSRREPLDTNTQNTTSADTADLALERELRLSCLEDCLNRLPAESRALIV